MSLHTRIRQKLEEKKLRAADLARATKKSPVAAKKWLDGTSVPTAENLKVIAKFLGVSDDWLLYGGSDEQESSNNLAQLNVIDIEAFKQKYNIPDSEDAVKFVQAPAKPFPIQKRYVPVKAYSKMGMDGYFTDMGYDGNAGDGYVPTHTAGPRAYGIKGTGDSTSNSLLSVNGGERFFFEMDEVESITAITDIVPPSQHRQEHPYSH
ncbi:helix-turn-helix domain-containing protein [Acinetobacter baumannii]|uniref:helix-turn-helix domain-containing protein n=1 Tax=Acinetobacter baumannii TaxID=470 RepID=UPI0012EE8855|nr:helix-turn-helix transcriptional regulator [Acinetobacter baumannii]MVO22708.1 helix-turn-helix domain-containing protein [Acinetobacter baumannii]